MLAFNLDKLLPRVEPLVEKAVLKERIKTAVQHGADLHAVEAIYDGRVPARWVWIPDWEKHYPGMIPLSAVLADIRADLFLGGDPDSALLQRLDAVLKEHTQTNPFDRLDPAQRDQFERLRESAGDGYSRIEREVTRISDELHSRNLAVDKYLRDATMSFWISIGAVIISVSLGVVQYFQARRMQQTLSRLAEDSRGGATS